MRQTGHRLFAPVVTRASGSGAGRTPSRARNEAKGANEARRARADGTRKHAFHDRSRHGLASEMRRLPILKIGPRLGPESKVQLGHGERAIGSGSGRWRIKSGKKERAKCVSD